jgi:hypothetical protein
MPHFPSRTLSGISTLTDGDYSFGSFANSNSMPVDHNKQSSLSSRMEWIADDHELNMACPMMPMRTIDYMYNGSTSRGHPAPASEQSQSSVGGGTARSTPSVETPSTNTSGRRERVIDMKPRQQHPYYNSSIGSSSSTSYPPPPSPSQRERVIDMKPRQQHYNNSSSIGSSISTSSYPPPQPQYRPSSSQRELIFGPPCMPMRRQSFRKNLNNDNHGQPPHSSAPRSPPQRNSTSSNSTSSSYEQQVNQYDGDDRHHYRQQQEEQQQQQQQQQQDVIMIDIAPGVKLPLRGRDETWSAIEEGNVTVTMCVCCNMDLNCIFDAQLVICPDCFMLSPVDQTELQGAADDSTTTTPPMHRHGVGVGIKGEEILRWVMSNS